MAWAYFDTSVLAKRYVYEPRRAEALKLLRRYECLTSAVTPLELRSAIRRRASEGAFEEKDLRDVLRRCAADREFWGLIEVTGNVLTTAEALVAVHPLRTLDAIHVASAQLVLGGLSRPDSRFVTADQRQADAASAVGLPVTLLV